MRAWTSITSSLRNSALSAASLGSVSSVQSTSTPTSPPYGKPWSPFEKMEHGGDEMAKADDSNDTYDFAKNKSMEVRDARVEEFLKQHGFSNIHGDRRPTLARKGSFKNLLRMSPKDSDVEVLYPIHIATKLGNYEMLLMLLASGADPKKWTSEGRTAIDIAREYNQDGDILELLYRSVASPPSSRRSTRGKEKKALEKTSPAGPTGPPNHRETHGNLDSLLQEPVLQVDL